MVALPTLSSRKEVRAMEHFLTLLISIIANVVSYYIRKWLDGDD